MLQSMRERMQGVIAGTIIVVVCITFALCGLQYYLRQDSTKRVVAKVNGKGITEDQVRVAYERMSNREMPMVETQDEIKQRALMQLVDERVMAKAIKDINLVIGRKQLSMLIVSMPAFQEKGRFSAAKFRAILDRTHATEAEFLNFMQQHVLVGQLEHGIIDSEFLLPTENDYALQLLEQKRDVGYFVVDSANFRSPEPTEEALNTYYTEHAAEFVIPESVSILYLQLSADALAKTIKPDIAELQNFYQQNIARYSGPKQWQVMQITEPFIAGSSIPAAEKKIQDIREKIKTGVDFKSFMRNKESATWIVQGKSPAALVSQVETLAVGELSQIHKTKDAYYLLKLLAVQPPSPLAFATVAERVRQDYANQRITQLFSEQSDKLAELTYTNPDSLQLAANALKLDIKESEQFTRDIKREGLLAHEKVIDAVFSDQVLKQGYNSNLIEIAPGNVVVLRVKEHKPETVMPLNAARTSIIQKLQLKNKQQQALDLSNNLLSALRNGDDPQLLSKKHALSWQIKKRLGRKDKLIDMSVTDAVFNLAQSKNALQNAAKVDLKDQYVIAKVINMAAGDDLQALPEVRRKEIATEVKMSTGEYYYQLWKDKLMKEASVKIIE